MFLHSATSATADTIQKVAGGGMAQLQIENLSLCWPRYSSGAATDDGFRQCGTVVQCWGSEVGRAQLGRAIR